MRIFMLNIFVVQCQSAALEGDKHKEVQVSCDKLEEIDVRCETLGNRVMYYLFKGQCSFSEYFSK